MSEPSVLILKNSGRDYDQLQSYNRLLIKKVTTICHQLAQNSHDDTIGSNQKKLLLALEYSKLLPESALIDYVLKTEQNITVQDFARLFENIPAFVHYDEQVWPIPYDFTPNNVYDWGRYDINLVFGKPKPKIKSS